MEGSVARSILASAFAESFAGGDDRIASGIKTEVKEAKDEYTSEPTLLDTFLCWISGKAYTGGHYFDANGKCQVKGELIERVPHGR